MEPPYFSLEKMESNFSLLIGQIANTSQALKVFDPSKKVEVTEFEGSAGKKTGWISKANLPVLNSVNDVRNFINSIPELKLVDFTAQVGDDMRLSTHDDNEVYFTVPNQHQAIEILETLLDGKLSDVIKAVTDNLGKTISVSDGKMNIFSTFDEYADSLRR